MADFRKWLFAFALVALLVGASMASAQPGVGTQQSAFSCVANAGTPVIVRYEGVTELVGDLLLQCTGGQPTPAGQQIPVQNVSLTLNTFITSRLVGGGYSDALLLIDDPYPAPPTATQPPNNPGTVTVPPNSPTQGAFGTGATNLVCESNTSPVAGQCNYITGTYDGTHSTAYGSPTSPYVGRNVSTIFAGRPTAISGSIAGNQITWFGIPIDAPGSVGVRVVRLTNIRANACNLGLSATLIPTQIVGYVSITGSQFVTINNPQQTLAYIQQGLFVSSTNTALQQCLNLNTGGGGIDSNINNGVLSATTAINLREGFAQSFKRRNYELGANPPAGGGVGTVTDLPEAGGQNERPQNIPGYAYNTESGFEPSTDGTTFNGPWGRADTGTRFVLRFSGIGQGARIFLPIWVPLTTSNSACSTGNPTPPSAINAGGACGGTWTGGFLRLIGTSDINGNLGSFSNAFPNVATFSGANPFGLNTPFRVAGGLFLNYAEITSPALSGGTAAAVYEVGNSDPSAVENANIAVAVAFVANTANNLPATGQVSVDAQFAPLSPSSNAGWGQASGSLPIPRFCDRPNPIGTFNISQCVCNLLFPFVSQAPGFDTGIAIANTSLDNINGVPVETGTIRMDFYGTGTGGIGFCTGSTTTGCMPASLQSQNTTVPMPGGNVMTYTLYGGPGNTYATGLQAVPGFTGYIVAQTKFRWCHGFAFLSDLGAQKLAEGYLAIQLDIYGGSGLNRTGVVGEVQAH